ncbi:MAG: glutamine--fructose-6-phosphate transaminase (isomerizing) [Blastochloris viridis]|uniref:Glutamine--fructose-6-phosphate aminotransferase [isomerizing] n=1 Tax=Blastochloris viridis TaxID=1079 RepID=A0A6N4R8M2_BLAVI|nr:MAG: glutamine--fructose-6-phosphate transaminase (isomerizing) [Blastochloris viridis]
MCGIVGVVSNPSAKDIVLTGLQRLEYRGYDSAGIATLNPSGTIELRRAVGKLQALVTETESHPLQATTTGIGHTRWATHGAPTTANAHPHLGQMGKHKLAVVHNGIIENYQELRAELGQLGATFHSQTDTETIPYVIANALNRSAETLPQAVHAATQKFRGSFAFVVMAEDQPNILTGTRRGAPLCVGIGEGTNYLASDPLALAGLTSKFIFLEDDDIATITPQGVSILDGKGKQVERPVKTLDLSEDLTGKGTFKHFMLKEIHEQPAVVSRLLQTYTNPTDLSPMLPLQGINLAGITHINIIACGTAYYASLVGRHYLEQYARIPVNVEVASEFRYRNPPYQQGGLFIAVSQSGETADTLAALEHAKAAGQKILVFTNVTTSSMARAADAVVDLMAGREVAVASTKAFMAMSVSLALFALQLAKARDLSAAEIVEASRALRTLPAFLSSQIATTKPLEDLTEKLLEAGSMLYLGRGSLAPIAFEGALKIKEIAYIHAEAYASGEMKHGPIALVDKSLPVVNLAASTDGLFEKTVSNLKEVEARHGQIILVTDAEGADKLDPASREKMHLITVPTVPAFIAPMVFTVPLQLLAYLTATAKGTDVDQPRNLAKSVTVE